MQRHTNRHAVFVLASLLLLALAGCAEPEETPPEQDPEGTEQQPVVDYSEDTCDDNSGERHVYLIRTLAAWEFGARMTKATPSTHQECSTARTSRRQHNSLTCSPITPTSRAAWCSTRSSTRPATA